MIFYSEKDNINDLYLDAIKSVSDFPEHIVKPRGMEIKEILNSHLTLTDPRKSLVTFKARKLNYYFAAAEKIQYLTGSVDPDRLSFYNSNYANFKNRYGVFDGDYSERIRYWLLYIYLLFKKDKDTRQAVISIYGDQDRHESKDIPCTIFLHFMIRDEKLNLTCYMRSNDLLWGFPYDVNAFCFIQQYLASALEVELGTYTHLVGSLHIYTEREDQLRRLLTESETLEIENPVIPKGIPFYDGISEFWRVLEMERRYRLIGAKDDFGSFLLSNHADYYLQLLFEGIDKKKT